MPKVEHAQKTEELTDGQTTDAQIESVLENECISVFFQPLVSVRAKGILGFEAFSRSRGTGGAKLDASDLFGQERDLDTRLKLCRLCRRKALEAFRPIFERHPQMLLFLNTDGGALAASPRPGHLEAISQASQVPGRRIVIELERQHLGAAMVPEFVAFYRERGFRLSIDLCGGMSLPTEDIFALKPDFLKFDRQLFTGVNGHDFKRDMVASLVRLSDRLGCVLVAKNVEEEDEALRLLEWGVYHQQGFYYTKDRDGGEKDPIRAFQQKVEDVNRLFRERAHADMAERRRRYEDIHRTLKRVAYRLADCQSADFPQACERVAGSEDSILCASILSDDGMQLTPLAFKRSLVPETPLLGPERGRGTDHGIREDVLHLKSGFDKYVLPERVSPYAKLKISTVSARFYNSEGLPYILCLEFLLDAPGA